MMGTSAAMSRGHEQIAVAVPPGPREGRAVHQAREPFALGLAQDDGGVARQERRLLDPRDGPGPDGLSIECRGRIVADHELAQDRLVDAAQDRLALVEEPNEGPKEGDARHKGFGAIDRVEHPHKLGVGPFGPELLTHDAVPGIPLVDQAPHDLLGAPVRRRDRGMVLLQLDRNVRAAEEGMDEVAAQLGQLDHEIAKGIEVHGYR
jgi:hypothetical protein